MRTFLPAALAGALVLLAAPPASAQCRLSSLEYGHGAIDHGRAIVSDYEQGLGPHVHFRAKSPQGWQDEQVFVLGNKIVFYRSPVAIDGDRAIAGSPESMGADWLSGRAFVFDRVGGSWLPTELVSPSVGYADFFGSTVALDGDVAVVGADHWELGGGDGLRREHVFEFDGTAWSEVAQIDFYGWATDVEGSTIVVGNDHAAYNGSVRVYERVGGVWTWTQQLYDTNPPNLGASVSLEGDRLAVGASWPATDPGHVRIYRRQSGFWVPDQLLVADFPEPGDQFGASVALSGSTLLVGAPGAAANEGRVHRYEHDGTAFVEVGSFGPGAAVAGFGDHVAFQREDAILSDGSDVAFYRLGFAEAAAFCPTTPNSTGVAATLGVEGCDSLSGASLTLVARGLPPGVLALSFFGDTAAQVPLGAGFRCVGQPLHRLPVGTASAAGVFVRDVDLSSGAGAGITSGGTWHFQVLYRDPAGPGGTTNLTNALSVGITP